VKKVVKSKKGCNIADIFALGASGERHANGRRLTANASNSYERAEHIKEQYQISLRQLEILFNLAEKPRAVKKVEALLTKNYCLFFKK
jgi:hypothetical protein